MIGVCPKESKYSLCPFREKKQTTTQWILGSFLLSVFKMYNLFSKWQACTVSTDHTPLKVGKSKTRPDTIPKLHPQATFLPWSILVPTQHTKKGVTFTLAWKKQLTTVLDDIKQAAKKLWGVAPMCSLVCLCKFSLSDSWHSTLFDAGRPDWGGATRIGLKLNKHPF